MVGQEHLLGERGWLGQAVAEGRLPSMILWGPPGSGKTTLARALARETAFEFIPFSAVLGGVAELRTLIAQAKSILSTQGKRTLLFIDEIHRFNKAQQDALLPHVERGIVTLIGATTENPSFAITAALLSRTRVLALKPLRPEELLALLNRALRDADVGLGTFHIEAKNDVLLGIAQAADGDARRALDMLENAVMYARQQGSHVLERAHVQATSPDRAIRYDKQGEEHYNIISAFIKSMRGSSPDASVYWLMRMIEAGEDPLFIMRRMIIFASEDVGEADPQALVLAVSADHAVRRLGLPECIFALSQCCLYLANAPKSNRGYKAWKAAQADVQKLGALEVPLYLRNAPTALMKDLKYGEGYRYPHDEGGIAEGVDYLPEAIKNRHYY
ncbi:MAG: replication-associated recombination protein A [Myxococcales bacterium]|nr:replication-associated recombination protein A [Myxococcales bacterium]MCB9707975.1 replication-associated recombination protein A [Myxococcales bacterium]